MVKRLEQCLLDLLRLISESSVAIRQHSGERNGRIYLAPAEETVQVGFLKING